MGNLLGASFQPIPNPGSQRVLVQKLQFLGDCPSTVGWTASSWERGTDFSTPAGVQHFSEWGEEESSSLWLWAKLTESQGEALWNFGKSAFYKIKLQIKNTITGWKSVGRNKEKKFYILVTLKALFFFLAFWTKGSEFSFCTELQNLCSQPWSSVVIWILYIKEATE